MDQQLLQRITAQPGTLGGKPCIRDTRLSVELILSLMAQGLTHERLLAEYPMLEPDDRRAALAYAHAIIADESLETARVQEA
jgi:uncharacterized protein (DUF433 family)